MDSELAVFQFKIEGIKTIYIPGKNFLARKFGNNFEKSEDPKLFDLAISQIKKRNICPLPEGTKRTLALRTVEKLERSS